MKIQDLRSQFCVFVFLSEIQLTADLKQSFVASGYETFLFLDQETLVHRVKEAAPHVIVFSPDALLTTLSDFTKSVLEMNSEVQFVCVAPAAQAIALNEYREFNFTQIIEPNENLQIRALWAVDTICEKLALQYQNENLLDRSFQLQQEISRQEHLLSQAQGSLKVQVDNSSQVIPLIEKFSRASSREEFIQFYLNHLAIKKRGISWKAVYFKFLPSVLSFVASQGHEINLERTKGIGVKISGDEISSYQATLQARNLPASFSKLVKEAFQIEAYSVFPLFGGPQVEGVFVFWGIDLTEGDLGEFLLFQLCYQNVQLRIKLESGEIVDPVTELHNKKFFMQRIDEEISRSRRLSKPVSIVRLGLDTKIISEQSSEAVQRNLVLRSIALLVKKTSRVNDFTCRTGDSEISLILPHCSRKGAAIRAERLRRAIESHSIMISGTQVTVSSGISEYPSLCSTAQELDQSASQALEFISSHGGNKVCLYKPKDNFKPDFEVSSV